MGDIACWYHVLKVDKGDITVKDIACVVHTFP